METKETLTPNQILDALKHFTGSEQFYQHRILNGSNMLVTDGIQFLKDACSCYWLIDQILINQIKLKVQPFQVWKLQKASKSKPNESNWELICEDGNDKLLSKETIPYSDFPLETIVIWVVDNVAILPSEY